MVVEIFELFRNSWNESKLAQFFLCNKETLTNQTLTNLIGVNNVYRNYH